MTNLEKQIVATIQNGGDIWDVVKIAQQYNNEQLIDRVLDNILIWVGKNSGKAQPHILWR